VETPIPVDERSEVWVWGSLIVGIGDWCVLWGEGCALG